MEGLEFYRCCLCGTVVSPWDLRDVQCCPKCSHNRVHPTNLSLKEKATQIIKHPKIWKWQEMTRWNSNG